MPLIIMAGQEYGTGSSRDWAAKGTRLLGVKAVVAQASNAFIARNLVGMGVLPLQFKDGMTAQSLGLDGSQTFSIGGLSDAIQPRHALDARYSNQRQANALRAGEVAHRYADRSRLLPARRNFAVRAAAVASAEIILLSQQSVLVAGLLFFRSPI